MPLFLERETAAISPEPLPRIRNRGFYSRYTYTVAIVSDDHIAGDSSSSRHRLMSFTLGHDQVRATDM